jgi:hypothetical protein
MTLIGGLTDVDGVMGRMGDDVEWWLVVLRAPRLLLTAFVAALEPFDELLLLLLLELPELLLPAFAERACVGVTFMCDDLEPLLLVELLAVLVVLLDDADVDAVELLFRVDELDDDFELLRFDDDAEV